MTPLRADAVRNRAKLLDVAEAVFAARGAGVSTEEIAREAGVGVGTLFRHFPTKAALLQAVYVGRLERLAVEAEELLAGDRPGAAFFDFFTAVVDQAETKNAFADALAEAGVDVGTASSETNGRLRTALAGLLDRAQQAGAVRSDVGVGELTALLVGASRAVAHAGDDRTVRDRVLTVLLDGLRAR
jgi:AcrR family transcriptional regulator